MDIVTEMQTALMEAVAVKWVTIIFVLQGSVRIFERAKALSLFNFNL